MKIAIIGPGAIGGTLAGWLGTVHDVVICARTKFDELVVETPGRTLVSRRKIVTDPADASAVDWVLAVTKTYDAASTAPWLARLIGPDTRLAIVQNGIEHLSRYPNVPRERTLPVIIDIPAERTAPGRILQRRNGDITAPDGDLGRQFCALFEGTALAPEVSDDFTTAIWRKLALNSAAVVSALTLKPSGVVRNQKAAALLHAIVLEAIQVGRAEGAKLEDSLADEALERLRQAAPESVNSLLGDRLAHRRTEIDARNGVIVRLGRKHGIATPRNEMAVALIESADD